MDDFHIHIPERFQVAGMADQGGNVITVLNKFST
jgi:hypothetical protein